MNAHQKRVLQSFRRVQGWLAERKELTAASGTGPAPALAQQAAAFDTAVKDFTAAASEQEAELRSGKGSTADARRLRAELFRHHLTPIARIAQAAIPDVVKMTEALRVPAAKTDRERLLALAEAMAKAGEQYKSRLVESGLPADFIEQLRSAAEAYKAAIDARGQAVGNRRGANERVREAHVVGRRGLNAIAALVNRQLAGDVAALAEFKQITRVTIKGVRGSIVPAAGAADVPEVKKAA